jgi:hypothetical protein
MLGILTVGRLQYFTLPPPHRLYVLSRVELHLKQFLNSLSLRGTTNSRAASVISFDQGVPPNNHVFWLIIEIAKEIIERLYVALKGLIVGRNVPELGPYNMIELQNSNDFRFVYASVQTVWFFKFYLKN